MILFSPPPSSVNTVKPVAVLNSGKSDTRFATSLIFADVTHDGIDDLIVTSPLDSSFSRDDGGALWVFSNIYSLRGTVNNCEKQAQFTTEGKVNTGIR